MNVGHFQEWSILATDTRSIFRIENETGNLPLLAQRNSFLLPNPFFQKLTNLCLKLGNIMTHKNWHNSQNDPNIHLYGILVANWHETSQYFLLLLDQLREAMTHAATNLWQPMLLPDTFLDFKFHKEDPYLSRSLFSVVLHFAKIQFFLFDKYLIFTMTIPTKIYI